jgi:hypothetical protein
LSADREQQVLEMCQNLVNKLDGQECMVWLSSLKKLKKFLSVHHFILVQLKLKFLTHAEACPDCINSVDCRVCKDQMQWLFSTLQPGVVNGMGGEWGEGGSKLMFGGEMVLGCNVLIIAVFAGDIVKQVIKSKLGSNMLAETIAKLTM